MKKFLPLLICLSICFIDPLAAQEMSHLEGTVLASDGQPLELVNIGIPGTSTGTTTDKHGNFHLKNISPGEYTIRISSVGYKTESRNVRLQAAQTVKLKIQLEAAAYELQSVEITGRKAVSYDNEVTYSATKTATPIKEIPQAISFVT